jgi:hypothetical protein
MTRKAKLIFKKREFSPPIFVIHSVRSRYTYVGADDMVVRIKVYVTKDNNSLVVMNLATLRDRDENP